MILENREIFDKKIQENKLTIVDFFANWCGPCKMLAPIFEEVSKEYENEANWIKVDVDNFEELSVEYQIVSIPTIIVFKSGQPIHRVSGFQDKTKLIDLLNLK